MARDPITLDEKVVTVAVAVLPAVLPRGRVFAVVTSVLFALAWIGARQKLDAANQRADNAISLAERGANLAIRGDTISTTLEAAHEAVAAFGGDMIRLVGDAAMKLPDDDRAEIQDRLCDAVARLTEHHPGRIES